MVTIHEIYHDDLELLVTKAFSGDVDLLSKYHIVNGTLEQCVSSTMDAIADVNKVYGVKCYMIANDGKIIGYMTLGPDFLHSFGINIAFRTKEVLTEWWEGLLNIMSDFFCTLHSKNTRAIEFLKKQGMIVHSEGNDLINLITCQ